jgi:CRISPR type I-E-associated protein CasB/Cse2
MSRTDEYIRKLSELQEGERSRLRRLAGQPLDATLPGFDLFTGLWWPLRQKSPQTPQRGPSWLVAKLHGAFPVPQIREGESAGPSLAAVLGRLEPREENTQKRFRRRFDALLCSPLAVLEPHLRWALAAIADGVEHGAVAGLDWAALLDDLGIWERGEAHQRGRDIREIWAEDYLGSAEPS